MNLASQLDQQPFARVLREVGTVAAAVGIEAYAVGGLVRDVLLGRATTDVDFVTVGPGTGIALAEAVSDALGGTTAHVYENFGTAAVRVAQPGTEPLVLEFVAARRESYQRHSRNPIVEDGTLADDQKRRDLTINAMAVHLTPDRFGDLIDPFDGLGDLQARVIRTPLDPEITFSDDPLRMIRAARFAAQLGFEINPETFAGMQQMAARVEILSQERITEELQKIICAPVPSVGFKWLDDAGVLVYLLPELVALKGVEAVDGHRHKDNFYHTLQVLDNLAEAVKDRPCDETRWLRWAALFHDIAKPRTKRFVPGTGWTFHGHEERGARMVGGIFRTLKLPLDERMRYVQELVRLHHRPVALVDENVTDSAVRRLLFEAGDHIEDLMALVRADITSKNPRRVRRYLRGFDRVEEKMVEVEEKDRLRNFQPPVDGHEIMDVLGVNPGLAVGILKDAIREAILDGEIPNEHDPAFAYMMARKDDALRRARLFEAVIRQLSGPERAATGAIKEAVVTHELPATDAAAMDYLLRVKAEALAQ